MRLIVALLVLPLVVANVNAQTSRVAQGTPQEELTSLMFDEIDRVAVHCLKALPGNAESLNGALRVAKASIGLAAQQYLSELGSEAQELLRPAVRAQWSRASDEMFATVERANPRRYCAAWPDHLLKLTPEIALREMRDGYRAARESIAVREDPLHPGPPPDDAVLRFVLASEVDESAVLAYSVVASRQPRPAKGKCESEVVLASRDIFYDWAVIATRSVFGSDGLGEEIDHASALLESKNGRDFIAARAQMQRDVTRGIPIEQAGADLRDRLLPSMPPEMKRPILRVTDVSRLLSDPRRFQQWPRYDEFVARLGKCSSIR